MGGWMENPALSPRPSIFRMCPKTSYRITQSPLLVTRRSRWWGPGNTCVTRTSPSSASVSVSCSTHTHTHTNTRTEFKMHGPDISSIHRYFILAPDAVQPP